MQGATVSDFGADVTDAVQRHRGPGQLNGFSLVPDEVIEFNPRRWTIQVSPSAPTSGKEYINSIAFGVVLNAA